MSTSLLQIYWIILPAAVLLALVIVHLLTRVHPQDASGPTIQFGAETLGEINFSHVPARHTFTAQAGTMIDLRVMCLTPDFAVTYHLMDQQGRLLTQGTIRYGQPTRPSIVALSTAGQFTLEIQSADHTTGYYSLSIDVSAQI